jgi:putative endonuclease
MKTSATGRQGEKLAQEYLKEHGYFIVETNYRSPEGEVDFVASRGDFLVFVEVRARSTRKFGTPEESLTSRKRQKLIAVSQHYLQNRDISHPFWRMDFIAVELDGSGTPTRIEHFEDAFGEEYNPSVGL